MSRLQSYLRPLAFLLGVLAIIGRAPSLLTEPRLWAEEGTRYFPYAFGHTWIESLLQVQHGYYAFWPNLAGVVAAKLVPLIDAPLITTLLALIVQVVPLGLILWGRSPLWPNLASRLLGMALYLLAPVSGEVWLNTINSQFFFSIIAALILNEEAAARFTLRQGAYNILLLLAGLTGPVSCFLLPLFGWRAWTERRRDYWVRAAILGACAAIEAYVITRSAVTGSLPLQASGIGVTTLFEVLWTQSVALCLLGRWVATQSVTTLTILANQPADYWLVVSALVVAEAGLFLFLAQRLPSATRRYLLGAYALVLLSSMVGILSFRSTDLLTPGLNGRYFYSPNVLLLVSVGQTITWQPAQLARAKGWLCAALLVAALLAGLANYDWPALAPAAWPKWRHEVALYEVDHRHPLAIWPLGWTMLLPE